MRQHSGVAWSVAFASPIDWYSVSPAMKIFLDRISDFLGPPDLLEPEKYKCGNANSRKDSKGYETSGSENAE
jgi:multimeric flavodoxin WrbA